MSKLTDVQLISLLRNILNSWSETSSANVLHRIRAVLQEQNPEENNAVEYYEPLTLMLNTLQRVQNLKPVHVTVADMKRYTEAVNKIVAALRLQQSLIVKPEVDHMLIGQLESLAEAIEKNVTETYDAKHVRRAIMVLKGEP